MRDRIRALLEPWKAAFKTHLNVGSETFIKLFLSRTDFSSAIKRWTPGLLEEIRGISEGSGVDLETMLVFQFADEYITGGKAIVQDRCSSAGYRLNDGTSSLIGQNMDIESYADGSQLVLHIKHESSDVEAFVLTQAGCIALNGMNNKAVGICCNALTQLNSCRDGLPVSCIVRGVLQQRSVNDAVDFLHRIKHASGQNYLVGGASAVQSLECSAGKVIRFKPKESADVVWHTNHPLVSDDFRAEYRSFLAQKNLDREKMEPNTRTRLKALERRLAPVSEKRDIDLMKSALSSRDSAEFPVSREKGRELAFTFASTVMVLSDSPEFHVAPGPPHRTPYEKLTF